MLADNGGPTPTHALLYDAANPALDLGGACGPVDQRGVPAPLHAFDTAACDGVRRGVGLLSMRERAEELGGTCAVTSSAEGTVVVAVLPGGER